MEQWQCAVDKILEIMMFGDIYRGKKVLLTGHTGFKGSWLAVWLEKLGAEVCGISLAPDTEPAHFSLLSPAIRSEICDIRDRQNVKRIFQDFQPEIVFHLAAQPLVRKSYREPVETLETNIMGTVHILESCRESASVRAIVAISSDKCYENREQEKGYRETDPMGGYDPYSASKGCMELVLSSYRRSFFNPADHGKKHSILLASARAGNVIGGGDWAEDRLVPDMMKAAAQKLPVQIRNPRSTRPWQHVLEPLSGYLALGEKLLKGEKTFAEGWNFGPEKGGAITVEATAQAFARYWEDVQITCPALTDQPHEAALLQLDCTKAKDKLSWHGVLSPEEAFQITAEWYKAFYLENRLLTREQLDQYIQKAEERGLAWTN